MLTAQLLANITKVVMANVLANLQQKWSITIITQPRECRFWPPEKCKCDIYFPFNSGLVSSKSWGKHLSLLTARLSQLANFG